MPPPLADDDARIRVTTTDVLDLRDKPKTTDVPRCGPCVQSFSTWKPVEEVLRDDPASKMVVVLGRYTAPGTDGDLPMIAKLSHRHFPADALQEIVAGTTSLRSDFHNDIYSKFEGSLPDRFSTYTIDTILPCTAKHIAKHRAESTVMISETPEMYAEIVKPYISSIPTSHIQWVYNILEGRKEADRVIHRDSTDSTGFTMLPDLKWDQVQNRQLYCIAIVHRHDLASLRDLTAEHLPLLKGLLRTGSQVIQEKYGVPAAELKVYLHYYPSYFHLHVHFMHTSLGSLGNGAGKGHLLAGIINNIETFGSDFYQKCTIDVEVGLQTDLYKALHPQATAEEEKPGKGLLRKRAFDEAGDA